MTFRWNATNEADDSDVNFAVTLFSDGRIRFDYGAGNTSLTPTVGISMGNGRIYRARRRLRRRGHPDQRQLGRVRT